MTRSNLPPQAYTREILAQAFDWLKDQPPSTHEMAQSADSLVSLFLSARRNNGRSAHHSSSASTQKFKSSLKTLSEGLKEFEAPPSQTPQANMEAQKRARPTVPPPPPAAAPPPAAPLPATPPPTAKPPTQTPQENSFLDDPHTKKLLSDVKHKLNLSSNNEALRMLVVLGYEKVQDILPKG